MEVHTIMQNTASGNHQQQIMHSFVNTQITTLYAGGAQQLPCNALPFLQKLQSYNSHLSKQLWLSSDWNQFERPNNNANITNLEDTLANNIL